MREYGAKSILYIPLLVKGQLLGFAELWESRRQRDFTAEEISLCKGIAQQAAVAIDNARLYEKAQQEIAERALAEEKIKASLEEKEVLLQEIHHRVKNNLQVVSSLLNLQSQYVEDKSALDMFQESQNRILSMALIHEKLYRSQDLSRVDLTEYIQTLAGDLVRSYRARSGPANLRVQAADVFLSIEKAVPCGLIVNELVSNALKHAFPANGDSSTNGFDADNEIFIGLSTDTENRVTLIVADNGVGLPQDLDVGTSDSLGLRLVHTLVSQLDGTLELRSENGAEFNLTFRELPG
jgi:two-component sensor histidine kinase